MKCLKLAFSLTPSIPLSAVVGEVDARFASAERGNEGVGVADALHESRHRLWVSLVILEISSEG